MIEASGTNDATSRIDAYVATAPENMRDALQRLRQVVRTTAPDAVEVFSYGIIGFKYRGKPLVYLGAAKKHYALYGHSGGVLDTLGEELTAFDVDKGTIRFSPDKPVPEDLVRRIVLVRIEEIDAAVTARKGPSRGAGS